MATIVMQMHLNVILHVHCLSCFPIANYNRYHSKCFVPIGHSKQHATKRHTATTQKYIKNSRTDTGILCRSDIRGPQLSLYQCTLLPVCTVATVQLLYAIPILTVTISVHTVTSMYGSHSTVTVCDWNPHCHYISAHCYQYVR